MKKWIRGLLIGAVLAFAVAPLAARAETTFVVKGGEWHAQRDGRFSDAPTPSGSEETNAGRVYWIFADPEMSDEAKGARRGLYFYSEKTKRYSFLPVAGGVNAVSFGPDGEMFVVEGPGEMEMNDVSLELFTFADLASQFKTMKAAGSPYWIDVRRFVFTANEAGAPRARPDDYPPEGTSTVLYDAVAREEVVLIKATATADFSVGVLNEENGDMVVLNEDGSELRITESYVESPKDWAEPDKARARTLSVPIPAAR